MPCKTAKVFPISLSTRFSSAVEGQPFHNGKYGAQNIGSTTAQFYIPVANSWRFWNIVKGAYYSGTSKNRHSEIIFCLINAIEIAVCVMYTATPKI